MKVSLLWYAPTRPEPDFYIALVMRRTRSGDSSEEIADSLQSKGVYCIQCKRKLMNDIHDADKGNPSNHKTTPLWVVNLVRGAKKWGHFDVLEHVIYSFEIKDVSRVLSHQLVRHRMASYSQISARIVATRGFSLPDLSYIYDRKRRDQIMQDMTQALSAQWDLYDHLREKGVRPEDARYIVGEGQTTSLIMTLNARSLAHIIRTRLNPEAQWEIRELASTLLELVKPTAPIIWEEPLPEGI